MREIKVFSFTELTEGAKKRAVEQFRGKYSDRLFDEVDCEILSEWFTERLSELGYEDMGVFWSLSHCQCDGMRFEGELSQENLIEIAKRLMTDEELELFNEFIHNFSIWGKVEGTTHHYYHYNTMRLTIESDFDDMSKEEYEEEYDDEFYELFKVLLEDFYKDIKEDIKETSKRLEREGYEHIEYHSTDEYIIDLLENNEHIEFYEDGTVF